MAISHQPMRTNFGSGIDSAETSTVFPWSSAWAGTKAAPSLESSNHDGDDHEDRDVRQRKERDAFHEVWMD